VVNKDYTKGEKGKKEKRGERGGHE